MARPLRIIRIWNVHPIVLDSSGWLDCSRRESSTGHYFSQNRYDDYTNHGMLIDVALQKKIQFVEKDEMGGNGMLITCVCVRFKLLITTKWTKSMRAEKAKGEKIPRLAQTV